MKFDLSLLTWINRNCVAGRCKFDAKEGEPRCSIQTDVMYNGIRKHPENCPSYAPETK